jgi:hypothetical protein
MSCQNPFDRAHDLIEFTSTLDLDYIDRQLSAGKQLAYDTTWIDNWKDVRQSLKFGYLINNIQKHGQQTPMQLLLTDTKNKYTIHPGTVRLSAIIAALNYDYSNIIYCWDEQLDPSPFLLDFNPIEITSKKQFLNLYNDNSQVYRKLAFDANAINTGAFKMQKAAIAPEKYFKYDFLTTFDDWNKKVEKQVLFKDVYNFHSQTECTISGIEFIKTSKWIRKSR